MTLPALGLPPDTHFRDLHASDAGQCLIVGISQEEDGVCQRLFVRGFQERAYREIPWPEGCNAFVDPIVSHVKAELYVLGQLWIRGAGNCAGLYQVSLPGGQIRLVHAGRQDSAPESKPPVLRWWISRLLGFTSDGLKLMIVHASERPMQGGAWVDYSVGSFEPVDGIFEARASLPAIFA
jgi:hypothetical protein